MLFSIFHYLFTKPIVKARFMLLFSFSTALAGCDGVTSDGGGECPPPNNVAITGLGNPAILSLRPPTDTQYSDSSFSEYSYVERDQSVLANRLLISVPTSTTISEPLRTSYKSSDFSITDIFIRSASALSCPSRSLTSQQQILDLEIISTAAFSDEYPAGSSLVTAFRIAVSDEATRADGASQPADILYFHETVPTPLIQDYIAGEPKAPLVLSLLLNVDVESELEHAFTITYKLRNGDVFTVDTYPVTVLPQ